MREVWGLQSKFNVRTGAKPARLLSHPRFRAAYDFMLLRAETGGADPETADWWARFQVADENEQKKMTQPPRGGGRSKTGRKRMYAKKTRPGSAKKEE
jgi:poly(A) polymerase